MYRMMIYGVTFIMICFQNDDITNPITCFKKYALVMTYWARNYGNCKPNLDKTYHKFS